MKKTTFREHVDATMEHWRKNKDRYQAMHDKWREQEIPQIGDIWQIEGIGQINGVCELEFVAVATHPDDPDRTLWVPHDPQGICAAHDVPTSPSTWARPALCFWAENAKWKEYSGLKAGEVDMEAILFIGFAATGMQIGKTMFFQDAVPVSKNQFTPTYDDWCGFIRTQITYVRMLFEEEEISHEEWIKREEERS